MFLAADGHHGGLTGRNGAQETPQLAQYLDIVI